jgi:hypothetical protein
MVNSARISDWVFSINEHAHVTAVPAEWQALYSLKSPLIKFAIEYLPPDSVQLHYQIGDNERGMHVLVTFHAPGCPMRSFHMPFRELSGTAKQTVVRELGDPDAFTRRALLAAARDRAARSQTGNSDSPVRFPAVQIRARYSA